MKSSPPVKRLSHRLQTQTEITPDDITVTSGLYTEIRFKATKKFVVLFVSLMRDLREKDRTAYSNRLL